MEGTGLDGRAELVFIVSEDGTVTDPSVRMASHPAFGSAAMQVINEWRFKPAIRNGRIVPVRVALPFVFYAGPLRKVNAMLGRVVYQEIDESIFSPVEVGGLPVVTFEPIPPYPKKYLGSGREEVIYVTLVVGPDGRGYNIEIEGYPEKEFVLSAILAASRYRFKPVTFAGRPVYVYTRLGILVSEDATMGKGNRRAIGGRDDPLEDYPDF